jgi:DNA modification methylase
VTAYDNRCLIGDCRDSMRQMIADGVRVQMCVTSPPYWGLRDYGVAGQLGLETTVAEYVSNMVGVFRLLRKLLADDGTLWLNLGDCYNSFKNLVGVPWRVAFALQANGWYLRQDIIWHKPNPMPESVKDRCTRAHEYLFLLTKSEQYFFDCEAIAEPAKYEGDLGILRGRKDRASVMGRSASGNEAARRKGHYEGSTRNRRSVWTIPTAPYDEAHFATFPPAFVEPCILAGSRVGDIVLDPFFGSGTVGEVAQRLGRKWIGCDLQEAYAPLQARRTAQQGFEL